MITPFKNVYFLLLIFLSPNFSIQAQDKSNFSINVESLPLDTSEYKFYQDIQYVKDLQDSIAYFDSLNVGIFPPKYFIKMDSLMSGFIHLGANASLVLAETNPILLGIAPYYSNSDFEKNNQELVSKDSLYLDNKALSFFFVIRFTQNNVEFERLLLITPSINKQALVAFANYPYKDRDIFYPVFYKSLKTIDINYSDK